MEQQQGHLQHRSEGSSVLNYVPTTEWDHLTSKSQAPQHGADTQRAYEALPLSAVGFVGDMYQSPAKSLGILQCLTHRRGSMSIFKLLKFNFGNDDKAVIRSVSHPEQLPEFLSLLLKGWCMCVHILKMLIVDNMIQWLNKLELTPSTCSIHLQSFIINAGDFVNWAGPVSPVRPASCFPLVTSITSKQSGLLVLNCIQEPSQKSQAMQKKKSKKTDSSQCTFTEQKFH